MRPNDGGEVEVSMVFKILAAAVMVLMTGCLTPQGRAVREASNVYLSRRLAQYCETPRPERDVYASALNRRLHFTGQIRIICDGEAVSHD